jgi:hypothetical protein
MDAGGEMGRVVDGFRAIRDVAACPKICKRQVRVDLAAFVKELTRCPLASGLQPKRPPAPPVTRNA